METEQSMGHEETAAMENEIKPDRATLCVSTSPQKSPAATTAVDPKVCGVCGDKALGNNFNAITCESCKAFFRRNALRTKEFVCPFSNNCKVDAITRRFCQRCRLKKCFDIGMKKEWIMTDEEKKIKKQKIEQNRKKRTSLENSVGADEASPGGGDEEDGDSEDCPPAAKKTHISTESSIMQRLTAPIISGLATPGEGDSIPPPTAEEDDNNYHLEDCKPPKILKQPMRPHNQTQSIYSEKLSTRKGSKGRNSSSSSSSSSNVITIHVNGQYPSEEQPTTSSPSPAIIASNHHHHHHSIISAIEPSLRHHVHQEHYPEHVRPSEAVAHYSQHPQQVSPTSSSWMEGDSCSNSSLSPPTPNNHSVQPRQRPPPPLIKYHPSKRQRMYTEYTDDHTEDLSTSNVEQTAPLLTSLIQPSHPESSPDQALSPIATVQHVESHSDEMEVHQQITPVSYHPSIASSTGNLSPQQVIHHHHHHPDYHDEYDRSPPASQTHSPPGMPLSHTEFHHHHYDSPSSYHPPLETDNHGDHFQYQYQDNRGGERHEHSHQASLQMPSFNTMDSILSIAIAAEFNSFGMLGGGNMPLSRDLNKLEQAKLNELLLASQALHAPVDAERPIPKESDSSDSLRNVINLTEIAIRRLIKMSKKISGFKSMCQEDQIALLKGGCTEMMILRSAVTYDPDRDSWHIPHSNPGYNINLGVLKEARGNLYEEHQRFNKSFRSQWRKDENIMIILCAITLFNPERHNVIHKDAVKLEQDSYYYLLKRYLESIMNGCEAKSNYLQLIRKIAELRALNSSHVRVFLEMNPKEVEPLLIEIFDLK